MTISPWVIPLAIMACVALASALAYWFTAVMSGLSDSGNRRLRLRLCGAAIASAAIASVVGWGAGRWLHPALEFGSLRTIDIVLAGGISLVAIASVLALAYGILTAPGLRGDALVAEIRRRLSNLNAGCVTVALVLGGVALVDTIAIFFYKALSDGFGWRGLGAGVIPILAWIINKVPAWFGGKDSLLARLLGKSIWTLALIAGVLLFLALAVGVHMLVQDMVFYDRGWSSHPPAFLASGAEGDWGLTDRGAQALFIGVVVLVLTLVVGGLTPFINLSSLHGIYAARLTRAYLGATNIDRLRAAACSTPGKRATIRQSEPHDQIPVSVYQQASSLGPIHLINTTLNETVSREGSHLLERDRKGVPLVFAPEGVLVDAAHGSPPYTWDMIARKKVESLSVGQLCAISGAAASTAMGSRTTLGGALTMTFANIRLGYWWNAGDMIRSVPTFRGDHLRWLMNKAYPAHTYFYLWNELTGRYSRDFARLNLSDGGHFDNSGAYELLRRRKAGSADLRVIVVCDNGADPQFTFGDLEVLVRKARLDLGFSINVASPERVKAMLGPTAARLFLNGGGNWRARAAARAQSTASVPPAAASPVSPATPLSPDDKAFALLLDVYDKPSNPVSLCRIIWLKPRLFTGLTQDVVGYALSHATFPHETTGNQFFNEAQWESYRALGYVMMTRLLRPPYGHADILRHLI